MGGHTEDDLLMVQLEALETLAITEADSDILSPTNGDAVYLEPQAPSDRPPFSDGASSVSKSHEREMSRDDIIADAASKLSSKVTLPTNDGPRNPSNRWSTPSKSSNKTTLGVINDVRRPASLNPASLNKDFLGRRHHPPSMSAPASLSAFVSWNNMFCAAQDRSTSSDIRFVLEKPPVEPDILYQNLHNVLVQEVGKGTLDPGYIPDLRLLDDLNAYTQHVSQLDVVTRLVECRECRSRLLKVSTDMGLSADPRTLLAINEDEADISFLVKRVLTTPDGRRAVTSLKGAEAERFMNLIEYILDKGFWHNATNDAVLPMAHRVLGKLSENCDILPSSLSVQGVTLLGTEAVFGGGFADIFRGCYDGQTVALKRLRVFQTSQERQNVHRKFCGEALLWQHLNHPYVLPFLGVDAVTFSPLLCMVSPWMPHGTIQHYIKHMGALNVDLLKFVLQIAQGIEYLHSHKVIHGDIRGTNILIDNNWNAVLADFGLAKFAEATIATQSTSHRGSIRWMAPELHVPESFGLLKFSRSHATDVYAFACTCLEIYSGACPFSGVPNETAVIFRVMSGSRPARPSGERGLLMDNSLWELIELCWSQDFAKRPSMTDVVRRLEFNHTY